MMRRIMFSVLFLVTCTVGFGQGVRLTLEKASLDSVTEKKIRRTLNFQIQFFARIFNKRPADHFQARIFGTEGGFLKYSREQKYNARASHAMAYYDRADKEIVLHMQVDDFPATFAHELCHALQHYYTSDDSLTWRWSTKWITEGLATLMQDFEITDSTYFIGGKVGEKIEHAVRLFNEGATLKYTRMHWDDYDDYIVAWSAMYFLYSTSRAVFDDLIKNPWGNYDLNFDGQYPGGFDALSIDSRSWILNGIPAQR